MFEYLMPLLVMPNYENTLLDHTCRAAVQQQMDYGKRRDVPWGISESGYNRTDVHLNYQYRAFGVPGLGFKRGLAEDLVIAPYATAMALMVVPVAACENLQRLAAEGRYGRYGFYEAVDYTPERLRPDETSATVRSFMAHHQGMTLLALDNLLRDFPMQRRFMACPLLRATDLLLQERMPRTAASVLGEDLQLEESRILPGDGQSAMRVFTNPDLPAPEAHLLSNGRYHVVITSTGGGYSCWRTLAVTRWREDATRDCWGTFVYVRDLATGEVWSTAYQPTLRTSKGDEAIFTQARAEFRQCRAGLDIHTGICVSPEDDVELRRITIINRSAVVRHVELTSFAEVVLAAPAADAAHPAFSNLFVQTEFLPASSALLCTRRPRSREEAQPWLVHLFVGHGREQGKISCETDRGRFIGRGGTPANPAAMQGAAPLSNTVGSVLDPIVSLRRTVSLLPGETAIVDLVLGVTESREAALAQVEKYQSPRMADRAIDLAWTHSQVTLRQLNATDGEAQLYGRLASALIYADPARRANAGVLRSNRRGPSGLWSHGISGDLPIVLLGISDVAKIEIARQLIQAHAYWRMKGLAVELVILSEEVSVYRQPLHEQLIGLVATGIGAQFLDRPGGIFVRRLEQVPHEDRVLLHAVARIVLDDEKGTLTQQLEHRSVLEPLIPALKPTRAAARNAPVTLPPRELIFRNGFGGFTRDGHEYVITLQPGQMTPAPWVNVLANPTFGTVVSESGGAYTWVENAHEFRLTPWNNDPIQDTTGEALYIRDEQTGQFWSPTPLPARGATPHVIRHGFGYTVYEHTENGLSSELWVYVAMDAPVKFSVLKLRNVSGRPRLGTPASRVGHRILGMGAGRSAAEEPAARANRGGPQDGRVAGAQLLQHRIPGAHRLRRRERRRAHPHRGSQGIPRAEWHPVAAGGDETRAALRSGWRRAGPVWRASGDLRSRGWPGAGDVFPPGGRSQSRGRAEPAPAIPARGRRPGRVGGGLGPLEPDARRRQRGHARSRLERPRERLVVVSDPELPPLGPDGVLSVGRRLRIPRPVAGRAGAAACRTGPDPRASPPRRRPSIRRGRCAALVASAGGARGANPFFRRLPVAALRDVPLRVLHRGPWRARRENSLPRGPAAQAGGGGVLRSAQPVRGIGDALPALRARDRAGPELRRARPASDRLRGLE